MTQLAEGNPGVAMLLRKRLAAFLSPAERPITAPKRTIQQILRRADQLERAAKRRQAEAARQKHVAEMTALAAREEETWKQVDDLLDNGGKTASVYDEATALLAQLEQLAIFQESRAVFLQRVRRLAGKYAPRLALIGRWKERGWV